jgi:hypothetical protein
MNYIRPTSPTSSAHSSPLPLAIPKKHKASALEGDASPVKNGDKSPSSSPGIHNEEVKKIPDELYESAETPFGSEYSAYPNKRKSKAMDDMFRPEHEDGGFKDP